MFNNLLWNTRTALVSIVAAAIVGTTSFVASAQVITVNTFEDVVDFAGAQRVSNLPGPDNVVSFREACIAANNTTGAQDIEFAIPLSGDGLPGGPGWQDGVVMLYMDFDVFILYDDETTVDFTTQTAFTGDTNPIGNEVGIQCSITAAGAPAIIVAGDRCIIQGLDRVNWAGYAIEISGNYNRVIGCTISGPLNSAVNVEGTVGWPVATGNVIGGTGIGEGNILAGVTVSGATDNTVIIGNTVRGRGVGIQGSTQYSFPCFNVRVGGPTPEEGNLLQGGGGIGQEGFPTGAKVSIVDADYVILQGNYIGTNDDGSAPYSQRAPIGVEIRNARNVTVCDNLISGIAITGQNHYAGIRFGEAVSVIGRCNNTQIYGNLIGTDATGSFGIPNLHGVVARPFTALDLPINTVVGGVLPGQANVIAFSEGTGVRIVGSNFGTVVGVQIRGNSIFSNGALGIDLLSSVGATGVSPNDPLDVDDGANGLQNFPVLKSAEQLGRERLRVVGALNSSPSASFFLDFFASPERDASGFGQGKTYLGYATVITDSTGNAFFTVKLSADVKTGWFVSSTATGKRSKNTSEFAQCVAVQNNRLGR